VYVLCLLVCSLLMSNFKISSINLNGARDAVKRAQLYDVLKIKGIDIAFVQETHSTQENAVEWKKEWNGQSCLSHKHVFSAGVGILFSKKFLPDSYNVEEIVKGRLLKVTAKYDKIVLELINVYVPVNASERMIFLNILANTIQQCQKCYLILGGDLNCTTDDIDRNHLEPHSASRSRLLQLIESNKLCDVWRNFK